MGRGLVLAAVLGTLVAGCGSDSTTSTAPSPQNKFVFTANLLPANEVPAVTGVEAGGSGTMTVTINTTRDAAGNVTAATVDFNGVFQGFPAGTILTGAHIHPGAAGVNGGVLVSSNIAAGEVTMPNGSGTLVRTGQTFPSPIDTVNTIIATPAGYYFNIHTAANPGGAARGQLTRTQ